MQAPTLALHAVLTRAAHLDTKLLPHEVQGRFEFDMRISHAWRALSLKDHFGVSLTLQLKARVGSAEVLEGAFTLEAVVEITHHDEATRQGLLEVFFPNQVMPYMRELVSSATARSGFPTLVLAPLFVQPPVVASEPPLLAGGPKQLH